MTNGWISIGFNDLARLVADRPNRWHWAKVKLEGALRLCLWTPHGALWHVRQQKAITIRLATHLIDKDA